MLCDIQPYFLLCIFIISFMASPTKLVRYQNQDTLTIQKTSIATTVSLAPPQKIVKQCRICLEDENEASHKKFITPCKCTGSVKHIHEECMRKWILSSMKTKSRMDQQKIREEGIQCEMCKHPIKFQMQSRYSCVNCEQLSSLVTSKSLLFAVVFILFLTATGGFCFSMYSVTVYSNQITDASGIKFEVILAICGAILLFLFAALALYTLVGEFLIHQILTVGKITPLSTLISRSRNQIMPVEDISDQNIEIGS